MNSKIIAIIAVALAVIAGSISAVIVTTKRADAARSLVEAARSQEDAEHEKLKAAEKLEMAEKKKVDAAKQEAENIEAQKKLAEAQTKEKEAKRVLVSEERLRAEAEADTAEELRIKAEIERQKVQDELKAADATNKALVVALRLAVERTKAEAMHLESEKLRHEREVAQIKALDLKRIDFEDWQQKLFEWKQKLDERERAIMPEKTSADLEWIGGEEDSVIDADGNLVRQAKKKYLAEKDRRLSPASRELARTVRLREESLTNHTATVRCAVVEALEKLYLEAKKADRPQDVDYYRKSIKVMYPDWKDLLWTNDTASAEATIVPATNVSATIEGKVKDGGK